MRVDNQFLLFLAGGGLVGVLIALFRLHRERWARILAFIPGLVLLVLGVLLVTALRVPRGREQAVLFLILATILLVAAAMARPGRFGLQIYFGGALALLGYIWVLIESLARNV